MHVGARFYEEEDLKTFGFKSIGKNVKIKTNVGMFFTENISIGDNVRIDDFTVIVASKESVVIGSNVNFAAHCYVAGSEGLLINDFCTFAPHVKIFTGSDDYSGNMLTGATIPKEFTGGKHGQIEIGKHVIVGAGSVILPDVIIGEGASVGALSLVNKNLYAWTIYAGIPVINIKGRSTKLLDLERKYKESFNE